MQGTVAQQRLDAGTIELAAVHHPPASAGQEIVEVDHHVDMRPMPPTQAVALVVQVVPAHVHQGVGSALGGGAGRFAFHVVASRQPEGGGQDGASLGVEVPVEGVATAQGLGQVQGSLWL